MPAGRLEELYATLEVPRNADDATIKQSYRKLVLKYHPDKNPEDRETAQQRIRAINAAYETLGNAAKRRSLEMQATAMEAKARNPRSGYIETSEKVHLRADVALPKVFMLSPMGRPDKFLRVVDRALAFHSREDVKAVGFEEFFAVATFSMSWLPEANNPDRRAKFGCTCRLSTSAAAVTGVSFSTVGTAGWLSFGLSEGVPSSDAMITNAQNGMCSNVILLPSPDFPGAFRIEAAYFPGHFLAFDPPAHAQMTAVVDRFATIDFMFVDSHTSSQFQTLDEVLIPPLVAAGGDKKHVKLTTVCQDPRVQTFFRTTMGNHVWDFTDFEIYFHAHWETWDYDSGRQTLRLRGPEDVVAATLARARTQADVIAQLTSPGAKSIRVLPPEVIGRVLRICGAPQKQSAAPKADANGRGSDGVQLALAKAFTLLKNVLATGEHAALQRLLPLCERLASIDQAVMTHETRRLRDETSVALGQFVSKALPTLKDVGLRFEDLGPLLVAPLDWRKCSQAISQMAQKLIAARPLEDLVPLMRKAATAKGEARAIGECLATSVMMKAFGASPSVAIEALDAMVSGGYGLEGAAMALRMVLPRVAPEVGARVVAGLLHHGANGLDLEACWEAISAEGALKALPAPALRRIIVASAKSAAVHRRKLDAACIAARTNLVSDNWQLDDIVKLLVAVPRAADLVVCGEECASMLKVAAEALKPQLPDVSSPQLMDVVTAISGVGACCSLLEAAATEFEGAPQMELLRLTQALIPLAGDSAALQTVLSEWERCFMGDATGAARDDLAADDLARLLALLATVAKESRSPLLEAIATKLLGQTRFLSAAGASSLEAVLANVGNGLCVTTRNNMLQSLHHVRAESRDEPERVRSRSRGRGTQDQKFEA